MLSAKLLPQAAPGSVCEQTELPDGAAVPAGWPPACAGLCKHIAAQWALHALPAGCQPAGAGEGHLPALPGLRHGQLPLLQGGHS